MKLTTIMSILAAGAAFSACTSSVQTTSGADYNRSVPNDSNWIKRAADVEPLLKFPANFCIVKTQDTKMVYGDPAELNSWLQMSKRHVDWGSFREINPAVVNLVVSEQGEWNSGEAGTPEIRMGAARQHCDAVLSYETRKGAGGVAATALLYDVRNGYSYVTASETGNNSQVAVDKLAQSVELAVASLASELGKR